MLDFFGICDDLADLVTLELVWSRLLMSFLGVVKMLLKGVRCLDRLEMAGLRGLATQR